MIWSELKIGDVVMVCEEEFGVIRNITSIEDILEGQLLNDAEYEAERDDLEANYLDGYMYTLEDEGEYARNDFDKPDFNKKSIREKYVLWKLEN
jgi:hypothetical protein